MAMRFMLAATIGGFALSACAGGAHHDAHGPAGIPYACNGRPARIVYEGGGFYPRGSAELAYEGRTIHFAAMPPTYGLRYQEPREERPILVWTARGEEARLSELGADASEREIAHCTRIREPGGEEGHGEEGSAHH
jgi:membrane-bound inhibitor of C-type lysozyme